MSPVDAFREAAATADRMVWLDGVLPDDSVSGTQPWSGRGGTLAVLSEADVSLTFDATRRLVLRHQHGKAVPVGTDIFDVLEDLVMGDDPSVLWAGYLGYACRPDLPARRTPGSAPDAVWLRVPPASVAEPNHSESPGQHGDSTARARPQGRGLSPDGVYARAFEEVQRQLRLGNSYEVNLTYREQLSSTVDPVTAYLRLRELNAAPYSGYLRHGEVHLLSSSPERFASVDDQRVVEARPIKGTTPRGATAPEDEEHRRRLASDPKYRAENLMIVDLLRNDISMVCAPGTVTVPELMAVESYPSVHQLVSTIRGRLADGVSTVGALRALFPAGSMTGAPKRRTMQIVEAVEATPRGVYAGAFGWISPTGTADLSVVIRSLVATPQAGTRGGSLRRSSGQATPNEGRVDGGGGWVYELGTGGAITVRSTLEEEYAETRWKAARLLAALGT